MALGRKALSDLDAEFESQKNLSSIMKQIYKANTVKGRTKLKLIIILILTTFLGYQLIMSLGFKDTFSTLIDSNINMSVGLLGLLIGSFSIVMSGISNDTLYCLILYRDEKDTYSSYKKTLLFCMEPLIWFSILLTLSYSLKIIYMAYAKYNYGIPNIIIIKTLIISMLLFLIIMALDSLRVFLVNIYNVMATSSRFEILNRYSKQTGKSIDIIIEQLENSLSKNNYENDKNDG